VIRAVGALTALLCFAFSSGCSKPTEIVLVVDTNLTHSDIDDVKVEITASKTDSIDVPLNVAGAPAFPLTLGLRPSDGTTSVHVSAAAYLQGMLVVSQVADTSFVAGEEKMLRLLLLDTCAGLTCPSTPGAQTCSGGMCVSAEMPGASLPDWSGTPPSRPPPAATVPIGGHTLWVDGWHSCANEGATLYCWGQNSDGEIGDGTTRNASARHPVKGLPTLATVGLGKLTSCACDPSGQAWCWGRNVEGELGLGSASASSPVPVKVPGVTDCVHIAGGANHTCVVHSGGTVSCWGSNSSGQLGQPSTSVTQSCKESSGATVPCAMSPMTVAGLSNVVEIHAGEEHTCARLADLTVTCWGLNADGELGDGTTTSRSTPATVTGLSADAVELACGRWFNCVRHMTGTLSCWGMNTSGQLGNGSVAASSTHPVDVAMLSDAIQIAAGGEHACALASPGSVWCWGGNQWGELGIGTTVDSLVPVQPVGLVPANAIGVGARHSCARTPGGPAFCWGENTVNQIGDGTATNRLQPVSVAGFM